MRLKILAATGLAALMATGAALAQTTSAPPATKAPPAGMTTTAPPAATAPATGMKGMPPAVSGTSASVAKPPAGGRVNLNTASATELDSLPGVGQARAKVIMAERAKAPFKDWSDFDARTAHTSVNAGVKSKIKDRVSF